MAVTLDPANKASTITLSGGDLIATATGNSPYPQVRETASFTTSQKIYCEALIGGTYSGYANVGAVNSTKSMSSGYFSDSNESWGYTGSDGNVYFDNGSIGVGETFTAGDRISLACYNGHVWVRKNAGNWNNSGAANPATDTGGFTATMASTTWYFGCDLQGDDGNRTVTTWNFGATAFAQSVPSGFAGQDSAPADTLLAQAVM